MNCSVVKPPLASEVKMYFDMIRARKMEEGILALFKKGGIPGSTHLAIGQEAVSIGLVSNLRPNDYAVGTYRGHNLALAKGVSMKEIFSEILGKATGCNHGYGGSMHLAKKEVGLIGNFSIVGAGIPVATGLALASKLKGHDNIVACFFGDGATNIGYFHESLNMAAIYGSPVVFAIENNLYAEYTPISSTTKLTNLSEKAKAYGIDGITCDGNDLEEVVNVSRQAIGRVRSRIEPVLIEFKTYRRSGHSRLDDGTSYRPQAEREHWFARDPIMRYRKKLIESGTLTPELDEELSKAAKREVEEAVQYAQNAPYPNPAEMDRMEFCASTDLNEENTPNGSTIEANMRSAIRLALIQAMQRDQNLVILGEDVANYGGVFKVTEGLLDAFGPKRVWDTPICENSMMGLALGLALGGYKPILELMFADFLFMAMDGLANEVAKMRWVTGGQFCIPIVIRTACGAAMGWASHHSQALDSLLLAVPGIKIVTPSNPYDAKGLLCASLRENDPVIFYEHKILYNTTGTVPSEYYTIPLGKAKVLRAGSDVTIVTNMAMVPQSLKAAELLAGKGISVEVIDVRCIRPLDIDTILSSVKKTGRLVTVEESPISGGWGNIVAATVAEKGLYDLKGEIRRIASPNHPVAFSPALEKETIPNSETISKTVTNIVSG